MKSKFEWNSKLSFMNEKKIVFQHLQKNFDQIYASLKHAKTNFVFQKILTQIQIVNSLKHEFDLQYDSYFFVSHIRNIS